MRNIEKTAQLFKMICDQYDGADLGKKAAQKLFYFFERKGIDLNLRYGIHYYGPYSAKLEDAMYELEGEGYLSIDISKSTHIISAGRKAVQEGCLPEEEEIIAKQVLQTFAHRKPLELEALSTMDYIANSILPKDASDEDIIAKFKEIKAEKFKESVIEQTLEELKELGLIVA